MRSEIMSSQELAILAKSLRTEAGLSQSRLGERLDVTRQAISQAEQTTIGQKLDGLRLRIIAELKNCRVEGPLYRLELAA